MSSLPSRAARRHLAILGAATLLAACSDDGGDALGDSGITDVGDAATDAGADTEDVDGDAARDADADPDADTSPECDAERRPIVMAHGFLASGDTWAPHAMRFASNGWCADRVFAFDWDTMDRSFDAAAALETFIDDVLESTGAEQVDLAGHSAGGGLGYEYLADPDRAAEVAHYVHIGSFANDGPAGPEDAPVPTLNIWSPDDLVVEESGDIPGATNVSLPGQDHYAVATSEGSFEAIYRFVTDGEEPAVIAIAPTESIEVGGRVVSLGENRVPVGASVAVWPVSAEDGSRLGDAPDAVFDIAEDGRWGPYRTDADTHLELRVTGPDDFVPVSYYREPQPRSNPLVYLRTLPAPGSLAGVLVSVLPFDGDAGVLVVFSASRALIAERDSLSVDGDELLDEATAAPENTTIALFVYDADQDGESDRTTVGLFDTFPFLAGLDLHLAGDGGATQIALGERVLNVRRRPGTEGAVIAVFD